MHMFTGHTEANRVAQQVC